MKKPYITALLLTAASLFGAQSSESSAGNDRTPLTFQSLLTTVTPLWKQVDAALKGPFRGSQGTQENLNTEPFGPKNSETEQKLRTQLSEAFEKAWQQSEPQDARIAALKNDIKSVMTNFFIENEFYKLLEVCSCVNPSKRISFAVYAARQLMQKFPNPNQKIIITAFASGLLLQEYLLLQLLTDHGYTNLKANFVDFGYPDPVSLRRVLNQMKKSNPEAEKIELKHYKQELIRASGISEKQPNEDEAPLAASSSGDDMSLEPDNETGLSYQESGMEELPHLDTKEQQRAWIKENKKLFPEFAELFGNDYFGSPLTYQKTFDRVKKLLPNVTLRSYKNVYDYIHFVQKYPKHKADMLSIVDPDLTVFDVAAFPSQANLLGLVQSEAYIEPNYASKTPVVFVVLAKDQPVQLYVQKLAYDYDDFISQDVVEKIRKKILKTGSDKKLSYVFRNWLINYFGLAGNQSSIKKLLEKNKALLEQAEHTPLSPEQTQQIFAELASVHESVVERRDEDYEDTLSYPTFSNESATRESALNYINDLQTWFGDNIYDAFKLVWYSDPHLAFQELVKETAKDDALIYLYYKYNTPNTGVNVRFEEETKSEYITKDVFGPIVGTDLLKSGAPSLAPYNPNEPVEEFKKFARVDLQSGNLETWDDIMPTLPEENRTIKDVLDDYPMFIMNDSVFPGKKALRLDFLNITSLEGLNDIPNIEEVQILYLTNNQLKEIPPRAFSKLKNLERIFLDEHIAANVPDYAFEGLKMKPSINSYDDPYASIYSETYKDTYEEIYDASTQLPEVYKDEESGQSSLWATNRKGISLEEFTGIPGAEEAQYLYFDGTVFDNLPPRAFSKFKNATYISLDYNPSLTGQTFDGLENVSTISLKGDVPQEEKNRLRSEIPETVFIFYPDESSGASQNQDANGTSQEQSSASTSTDTSAGISREKGWSRLVLNLNDYLETAKSGSKEEKQQLLNKFKKDAELMAGLEYGYYQRGDSRAESIMAKLGLLND